MREYEGGEGEGGENAKERRSGNHMLKMRGGGGESKDDIAESKLTELDGGLWVKKDAGYRKK